MNTLRTQMGKYHLEQLEAWQKPHHEVMQNYDDADALSKDVYAGIVIHHRLYNRQASTFEEAIDLCECLVMWHEAALHLLERVNDSEEKDFPIEGAELLRANFEDSSFVIHDANASHLVLKDIVDGRGIPFDQWLDAL